MLTNLTLYFQNITGTTARNVRTQNGEERRRLNRLDRVSTATHAATRSASRTNSCAPKLEPPTYNYPHIVRFYICNRLCSLALGMDLYLSNSGLELKNSFNFCSTTRQCNGESYVSVFRFASAR